MSTYRKIDVICIAAIIFAIVLTALLMSGKVLDRMPVISEEVASTLFSANDLEADWDTSFATKIVLSDKGSAISGNGAYVYEGNVYIAYAGYYVITGELTNGSIIIDADKSDKIWVLLDGVTVHCDDGAAIWIEQADNVFLTLADGTENTISSGAQYNEEIIASGVDGTIYSRDDLTINGTGTLVVSTEYHHGIVCNDDLVITGGNITINAVQDGIHANDSVRIQNSEISISAGDDGITVSNDDETAFLYVESGSISIPACYEGLEAVDITIAGGTIDITSADDGINASGSGDNSVIRITGGDLTIINSSGRDADGLDSNGSIYMEGGNVFISVSDNGGNCALDYGSENGGECVISGGTVIACGGSAMAEGFDADSTQGFLMYNTTAAAGTTISLEDSEGRELLSADIPCSFSSAVFSVPELKVGDVCTIMIGDTQEQVTVDNSSSSGFGPVGMFGGGGMHNGRNHPLQSDGQDLEDKQGMKAPERPEDALPVTGMIEPPNDPVLSEEREGSGGREISDDREFSGNRELPDREGMADGGSWPGRQGMREAGGGLAASDAGQVQADGTRLIMLGISALVLVMGLLVAIRIKY